MPRSPLIQVEHLQREYAVTHLATLSDVKQLLSESAATNQAVLKECAATRQATLSALSEVKQLQSESAVSNQVMLEECAATHQATLGEVKQLLSERAATNTAASYVAALEAIVGLQEKVLVGDDWKLGRVGCRCTV